MALAEPITTVDLEAALKALASERRLQILEWLKDVPANFPPQEHGDPIDDGACNQFIVDKLGVSQPAGSRHLKVLVDAGLDRRRVVLQPQLGEGGQLVRQRAGGEEGIAHAASLGRARGRERAQLRAILEDADGRDAAG